MCDTGFFLAADMRWLEDQQRLDNQLSLPGLCACCLRDRLGSYLMALEVEVCSACHSALRFGVLEAF